MTGKLRPQFSGTDWNNFSATPFWPKWQPDGRAPVIGDKWIGHFWSMSMTRNATVAATQIFSGGSGGTVKQYMPGLDGIQSSTANLRLRTMENIQIPGVDSIAVLVNGAEATTCAWQGARYQGSANSGPVRALIEADCLARRMTTIEVTGVTGAGAPQPPVQIDTVTGPHSSSHGQDYWLQQTNASGTLLWFYWIDIDSDPDPDIRQPLPQFLANPAIDHAYRADVWAQAASEGYAGPMPV